MEQLTPRYLSIYLGSLVPFLERFSRTDFEPKKDFYLVAIPTTELTHILDWVLEIRGNDLSRPIFSRLH